MDNLPEDFSEISAEDSLSFWSLGSILISSNGLVMNKSFNLLVATGVVGATMRKKMIIFLSDFCVFDVNLLFLIFLTCFIILCIFYFLFLLKIRRKTGQFTESQGRGGATVTWEVALDSSRQGALNDVLIL